MRKPDIRFLNVWFKENSSVYPAAIIKSAQGKNPASGSHAEKKKFFQKKEEGIL